MICSHYQKGQKLDVAGLNVVTVLVDRSLTQLTEVGWNRWGKGLEGPPHSHEAKEQTFFVLSGRGQMTIGSETCEVGVGDVIFVPWNAPHTTAAPDVELSYICFNTLVIEPPDKSFAESYQRVASGRIARWKSGDPMVGE